MADIIVTSESQLVSIIENTIGKILKNPTASQNESSNISGIKDAVRFLNEEGYSISKSQFAKLVAKGAIPCKKFHAKCLLFSKNELLAWAKSRCETIGQSDVVLTLAKAAQKKRR